MKTKKRFTLLLGVLMAIGIESSTANGADAPPAETAATDSAPAHICIGDIDKSKALKPPKPYSPYVDQHFPLRVLFGDCHHHTSLSVDSGVIGNKTART